MTVLPNGRVLVTGGAYVDAGQAQRLKTAEIYDPDAGAVDAGRDAAEDPASDDAGVDGSSQEDDRTPEGSDTVIIGGGNGCASAPGRCSSGIAAVLAAVSLLAAARRRVPRPRERVIASSPPSA
jgi:hypothetical protein